MAVYTKDPAALLDYVIDWSEWLNGDVILSSLWVAADGADIDLAEESNTATASTVWVSGGTVGHQYDVTNQIITAAGRIDERTITIQVRER